MNPQDLLQIYTTVTEYSIMPDREKKGAKASVLFNTLFYSTNRTEDVRHTGFKAKPSLWTGNI